MKTRFWLLALFVLSLSGSGFAEPPVQAKKHGDAPLKQMSILFTQDKQGNRSYVDVPRVCNPQDVPIASSGATYGNFNGKKIQFKTTWLGDTYLTFEQMASLYAQDMEANKIYIILPDVYGSGSDGAGGYSGANNYSGAGNYSGGNKSVHVSAYTKANGTQVATYNRRPPSR